MKRKNIISKIFALVFACVLFVCFSLETGVSAEEADKIITFGFIDGEAFWHQLTTIKENETFKMYIGQAVSCAGRDDIVEVIKGNDDIVEISDRGPNKYITALKSGSVTIKKSEFDNSESSTFNVEVADVTEEKILSDLSRVMVSEKRILKLDSDGKVREYYVKTLKNDMAKSFKVARLIRPTDVPKYKTVKSGKTYMVENRVEYTYENIKAAKKSLSLSKKQVKKLKAGKTVNLTLPEEYYDLFDVYYSGFYLYIWS